MTTTNLKDTVSLTMEQAISIRDGLFAYASNKGISDAKLAVQSGISKSHISNFRTGKFDEIGPDAWNKADSFLKGAKATSVGSIKNDLVPTDCFTLTIQTCEESYKNRRNNFVIGDTGYGKTTALLAFQRNCTNSSYVLCKGSMILSEFARDICKGMGITSAALSIREMREEIADVVKKSDKYVILIDDFDKLSIKGLPNFQRFYGFIQELIDACNGKLGTVIVGVPNTMTQINKCVKLGKTGIKEFLGRAKKYTQILPKPSKPQLKEFVAHYGITDCDAQVELANMADNYRAIFNMVQNCLIATNGNPAAVNAKIVESINADKFIG